MIKLFTARRMCSDARIQQFLSWSRGVHCLSALGIFVALLAPGCAGAQEVPAEVYGPWNAVFLADGPGITQPAVAGRSGAPRSASSLPGSVLEGKGKWTIAFWFKSDEPANRNGLTPLAGLGDLMAKDARFVAFVDGRLGLWMGGGQEHFVVASSVLADGWHFAVATGDGSTATLYCDGVEVGSGQYAQENVAAHLRMAPDGDHHFGGKIAALKVYDQALTGAQVSQLAAHPPDFDLPQYMEASAHWPVQTRGMVGQPEPQDPSTLPHGKGAIQSPVAQPVSEAERTSTLAGKNPWAIRGGWKLAAAPTVKAAGAEISKAGFAATGWMAATVPGTVLTTMIDRGVYPDPDYGLNNLAIPESLAHQDYWYRVEFKTPATAGQRLTLTFGGVNYAAEVWLNGKRLGDFQGAFLRGNFDVTDRVSRSGVNALAVRVSPPPHPGIAQEESIKAGPGENGGMEMLDGPTFGATEGWDWIPSIRDRNTGIWQDVTLTASRAVDVGDLNVITTLPRSDASEADVEIEVPLANSAKVAVSGTLMVSFDNVKVTKSVVAKPGDTVVLLKPEEFAQLKVQHPKLWWPNGYGEPNLHHLTVRFTLASGVLSSERAIDFGMREVTYELTLFDALGHLRRLEVMPSRTHDAALPLIDESHGGIRQIVDRTPDLEAPGAPPISPEMAAWSRQRWVHTLSPGAEASSSIRAVDGGWPGTDLVIKVNGVRIAARGGNWGMDDSRKRVSVEHLEPYFRLHRDSHVNMIRNWMGQNTEENFYALADKYGLMVWNDFWESTQGYNLEAQDPQLFLKNARDSILRYRHHASITVWCGRNEGVPQPIINEGLATLVRTLDHTRYYTGSSNQVNLRNSGPYQLKTLDTYYRINRGFSVELGIPSVPTLEGLQAFIPEPDLWPISDTWAYHDWHAQGNGAVKPFMDTMTKEFGEPVSLEDFERKAQMIDYAAHRAMFEGFAAHLWEPNSARMIWMTQPAWPSTEWNFLGHDYDTQSSFYGSQKACEPVHAQLNLEDLSVDLINLGDSRSGARALKVRVRTVGLDGKTLSDQTTSIHAAADARTAVGRLALESTAAGHAVLVKMDVTDDAGTPISDNLYWWAKDDASFREMGNMAKADLTTSATMSPAGGERKTTVHIKNAGAAPAVLVKLTLKDAATGTRILPAYYSENYVSLLAGEEREVSVTYPAGTQKAAIGIRGWNVETGTVEVK